MTFKKLLAVAGASVLYFVSNAFAAAPTVQISHTAVKVVCPRVFSRVAPVLKIQRLSIANHGVIKEVVVTKSFAGVLVGGGIFTFAVDSRGDNTVLGHLPGLFVLNCHHADNRNVDAIFSGIIN